MKAMSLKEITTAVGGCYYGDVEEMSKSVTGVTIDSRKIEAGYLFVPIKGARVDGHDFISTVMAKGSLCTLSERILEDAKHPYILVKSCKQALKDLAEHYRNTIGIKVVGISGSVGKTSTKEMIASVLSQKYKVLKTEGNFNNEIGLPLTVFNICDEHQVAVLEMGISDFGEMHRLAKIAKPDVCVITNIGLCHLENLGDRDGVLKAKTEMFDYMQKDAKIILNGDDDKLISVKQVKGIIPKHFGLSDKLDVFATNIKSLSLKGTSCSIHISGKTIDVVIPIPGHHMVYNALAGAVVGQELGLTPDEIKAGIEALIPVTGRNNLIETDSLMIIDDCYNANPVSTKASLDVLSLASSRKVAILGDMFELGENERQLHFEVGKYAAGKKIDLIVCIGELSAETLRGAKEAGASVIYFKNKSEFLSRAEKLLKKGDAVLIKASNGMAFAEIVENLRQITL